MQHCLTPPPPLRERLPFLSPNVEQVILQALAKDQAERYSSVTTFAEALVAAQNDSTSTTVSTPPFGVKSSHASSRPNPSVMSEIQKTSSSTVATRSDSTSFHEAQRPLAPGTPSHRSLRNAFVSVPHESLASPTGLLRCVFWVLVSGGSIGYFSSGFLLLLYRLAVVYGRTNLFIDGVLLLPGLGCFYLASWLTRKYTGSMTLAWIAGGIASVIQQCSAAILSHALFDSVFPTRLPILLLLWGIVGGVLGLLKVRRYNGSTSEAEV